MNQLTRRDIENLNTDYCVKSNEIISCNYKKDKFISPPNMSYPRKYTL